MSLASPQTVGFSSNHCHAELKQKYRALVEEHAAMAEPEPNFECVSLKYNRLWLCIISSSVCGYSGWGSMKTNTERSAQIWCFSPFHNPSNTPTELFYILKAILEVHHFPFCQIHGAALIHLLSCRARRVSLSPSAFLLLNNLSSRQAFLFLQHFMHSRTAFF